MMSEIAAHVRRYVVIGMLLGLLLVSLPPGLANAYHRVTFYPITGDLLYDGYTFADSYFRWDTVAAKRTDYAGYEHDLVIETKLFTRCTSYTDLPRGYDDCPTAGWDEESDHEWVFTFGSFELDAIADYQYYMGAWRLGGGTSMQGNFRLYPQESQYIEFCPLGPYQAWCRKSYDSEAPFVSGTFYLANPPQFFQWNLSD